MKSLRWTGLAVTALALVVAPLAAQEGEAARPRRIQPAPAAGQGQKKTQEDYIQQRDAKLGEAWLKNAPWIVMDFDKAKAAAKASGKPIFAYFTRSYAP